MTRLARPLSLSVSTNERMKFMSLACFAASSDSKMTIESPFESFRFQ